MTREAFDDFKSKLESAEIKSYAMYVCGGNLTIVHEDPSEFKKPTGIIIDKGDYVIALQRSREYMSNGKYDICYYPLDMCDAIFVRNLSTKEILKITEDIMDETVEAFIKNTPAKRLLNPEPTTTIGEESPINTPVLSQYHKEETIKNGVGDPEVKYHSIIDIENLPKTEQEVETIPPRPSEEEEG